MEKFRERFVFWTLKDNQKNEPKKDDSNGGGKKEGGGED